MNFCLVSNGLIVFSMRMSRKELETMYVKRNQQKRQSPDLSVSVEG